MTNKIKFYALLFKRTTTALLFIFLLSFYYLVTIICLTNKEEIFKTFFNPVIFSKYSIFDLAYYKQLKADYSLYFLLSSGYIIFFFEIYVIIKALFPIKKFVLGFFSPKYHKPVKFNQLRERKFIFFSVSLYFWMTYFSVFRESTGDWVIMIVFSCMMFAQFSIALLVILMIFSIVNILIRKPLRQREEASIG